MANKTAKYAAFISYAHAQQKFASWLHSRLESFRPPRDLEFFQITDRPNRISPVYRDREELSASSSLSDAINEALRNSAFLVVVASEDAARSRWVEEEVRTFRALYGVERILVAVPPAPKDAPHAIDIATMLPPTLRDHEPLAADFRRVGDGAEAGLLRLVAAIADVDFARLRDREGRRYRQRLAAGAALLALAASAAGIGGTLLWQRFEQSRLTVATAQGERAQAQAQEELASIRALFAAGRNRDALVRLFALNVEALDEPSRVALLRARLFWSQSLLTPEHFAGLQNEGDAVGFNGGWVLRTANGLLRLPPNSDFELYPDRNLAVVSFGDVTDRAGVTVVSSTTGRVAIAPRDFSFVPVSVEFLDNGSTLFQGPGATNRSKAGLIYTGGASSGDLPRSPQWASADCTIGIIAFAGRDGEIPVGSTDALAVGQRVFSRFISRGVSEDGAIGATTVINRPMVRAYGGITSASGETLDVTARFEGLAFVSLNGVPLPSDAFPATQRAPEQLTRIRELLTHPVRWTQCGAPDESYFSSHDDGYGAGFLATLAPPFIRREPLRATEEQSRFAFFGSRVRGPAGQETSLLYAGPVRGGDSVALWAAPDSHSSTRDELRSCAISERGALGTCRTLNTTRLLRVYPQAGLILVQRAGEGFAFYSIADLRRIGSSARLDAFGSDEFNYVDVMVEPKGDGLMVDGWNSPQDGFTYVSQDAEGRLVPGPRGRPAGARFQRFVPMPNDDVILIGDALSRFNVTTGATIWTYGDRLIEFSGEADAPDRGLVGLSPDGSIMGFVNAWGEFRLFDTRLGIPLTPRLRASLITDVDGDMGYLRVDSPLDVISVGNDGSYEAHVESGGFVGVVIEPESRMLSAQQVTCRLGARLVDGEVVDVAVASDAQILRRCGFSRYYDWLNSATPVEVPRLAR